MTPRQHIAKQRRPYVLATLIGGGCIVIGLLLKRLSVEASFISTNGRWSGMGCLSVGLVIIGFVVFLISISLLSFRGNCPVCGRNMGPVGWRRKNYCPLCGVDLDKEVSDTGLATIEVLRTQRKEWLLHSFNGVLVLLNFALMNIVVILFHRIMRLEIDRTSNSEIIGSFYAQASTTQKAEDNFRTICLEYLKMAQPSNYWDRLWLPTDEEEYRKKVLDAFEKELAQRKSGGTAKDSAVNQSAHGTR